MTYRSALALLMTLTLLSACGAPSTPNKTGAGAQAYALVKIAHINQRRLAKHLTAYGKVAPNPSAVQGISTSHAGVVAKLFVGAGQRVALGDRLLQLTTQPSALTAYESAKAQVDYAKGNLAHVRSLYKAQLATNSQLASAQKALANAKATLKAQIRLGNNKAKRTIRAPYNGIVSALNVAPGDRVAASTLLMKLANRNRLWVRLGVQPEARSHLKPGLAVELTPVYQSATHIQGSIQQLHAALDPATRLVDAIVALSGAKTAHLVPGMWMRGLITVKQKRMLAVPCSAVLTDKRGAYLFVVRHQKAHRVGVTTAFSEGGVIGIRGPVKAGEAVVVRGNYELKDGTAVREARG